MSIMPIYDKDSNQQVFYAAESGISVAKKYISDNINTSLITVALLK